MTATTEQRVQLLQHLIDHRPISTAGPQVGLSPSEAYTIATDYGYPNRRRLTTTLAELLADTLKTADLSPDGLYRYELTRVWGSPSTILPIIMLNPSTADAEQDDPTIRRCVAFARSWGRGGIRVVNLYALRATRPERLWEAADPVGPLNDDRIRRAVRGAPWVLAAWGANARPDRVEKVRRILELRTETRALGFTKAGAPRHPLFVKGDTESVVMWR